MAVIFTNIKQRPINVWAHRCFDKHSISHTICSWKLAQHQDSETQLKCNLSLLYSHSIRGLKHSVRYAGNSSTKFSGPNLGVAKDFKCKSSEIKCFPLLFLPASARQKQNSLVSLKVSDFLWQINQFDQVRFGTSKFLDGLTFSERNST